MTYNVSKRPATWVWKQVRNRRARLLALAAPLALSVPIVLTLSFTHHVVVTAIASSVLLTVALILWNVPDKWGNELDRWRLGARAEQAIGELLDELRGEGFIVMHDIEQEFEGNIDHLVSGPTGVFMIESKAKGYPDEALLKARRQAAKIHDDLDSWVVPVICIHERDREPFRHEKVWIVPAQHLLNWIRAQHEKPVPFERLARYADTVSS
jgi:hypothetical protein